jgi:ribosomal protein S18 acetylase RimI-like enzyme
MAVEVRPATIADAATIAKLVQALSLEEGHPAPPLRSEDVRVEGFGPAPRFRVLIAELNGRASGYALYYRAYATDHAARGFYLQDLYVRPEARRRGIGRALMAALARACRADGGSYLFWNALERNQAARAFYQRIGACEERVVTLSLQQDALVRLAEAG